MLHKDPFLIAPETFELLIKLQELSELDGFNLVGDTALALQLGHRNSIDIDLFTASEFSPNELLEYLQSGFEVIPSFQAKRGTLLSVINTIKVDFVRHNYPLLNDPITKEGVTFLSLQDIAAMKLHAITNSGKRLKDFVDIYYLLEHFCMEDLIGFYAKKYTNFNPMIALRAVGYFDDIDPQLDPPKMQKPLPLETIKERIRESILHSKKQF